MTRIPSAERRRALVDAAVRVIVRDGMAGASTRAIATEAGMSLASLHYVFGSRDALVEAVVEQVTTAELDAALAALPLLDERAADGGIETLLISGVDRYVDLLLADPAGELALAEVTVHAGRTGLHDLLARQRAIYLAAARANLERATALAQVTWSIPPDEVASLLVTLLDGITYAWLAHRDDAAARASGRFAATALARLADAPPDRPGGPRC